MLLWSPSLDTGYCRLRYSFYSLFTFQNILSLLCLILVVLGFLLFCETPWLKSLWEGKHLFLFYSMWSMIQGSQGRNWYRGPRRVLLTDLFVIACSVCFLMAHRTLVGPKIGINLSDLGLPSIISQENAPVFSTNNLTGAFSHWGFIFPNDLCQVDKKLARKFSVAWCFFFSCNHRISRWCLLSFLL